MAYANTSTTLADDLQVYYSDDKVPTATFKDNPFLAMMKKLEKQTGSFFGLPIVYGAGQSFSGTFATTQTQAGISPEGILTFQVTRVEQYDTATIASKLIDDSSSERGAFLDAVTLITDNHMEDFVNRIGVQTFGFADGNLGTLASTVDVTSASKVITFTNPLDIYKLEYGMAIDLAGSQTSGGTRALSGATNPVVTAIDYAAGTFLVSATAGGASIALNDGASGFTSPAAGDYVYQAGCRNLVMTGFQSWVPYGGVTTSDSFFAKNRSVSASRLAGQYLNAQGAELKEALETASAQVAVLGGNLSHLFMSYKHFQDLSKSLGAQQQYVDVKVGEEAVVGFSSITIAGQKGPIRVIADRNCPSTVIAGVDIKDWQLNSIRKVPNVFDRDGNIWLRSTSASGMEFRILSNSQIICKQPRNQINISVLA